MLLDTVTCLTSTLPPCVFVDFSFRWIFVLEQVGGGVVGTDGIKRCIYLFFQCREQWSQLLQIIDYRLFHWGNYEWKLFKKWKQENHEFKSERWRDTAVNAVERFELPMSPFFFPSNFFPHWRPRLIHCQATPWLSTNVCICQSFSSRAGVRCLFKTAIQYIYDR